MQRTGWIRECIYIAVYMITTLLTNIIASIGATNPNIVPFSIDSQQL